MRLDEGKGGGHSHAILSAFKGEIIILVLKGPVDSMFQNYLHAMLAMILLCTGLVRPGGRGCMYGLRCKKSSSLDHFSTFLLVLYSSFLENGGKRCIFADCVRTVC